KVQSLHFARPRAHEREPLVIRVNQLRRIRQGIDEDTEPTEWIRACELLARSEWHRRPAHAVIAVAAGDEIAAKLVYAFALLEASSRLQRGSATRARPIRCRKDAGDARAAVRPAPHRRWRHACGPARSSFPPYFLCDPRSGGLKIRGRRQLLRRWRHSVDPA